MRDADLVGVAGVPGNGPFLVVYLRLDGDRIREAAFQTHGCAPSIASGSVLVSELPGTLLSAACDRWTAKAIEDALGGVPAHKRHCPALAAAALKAACESRVKSADAKGG